VVPSRGALITHWQARGRPQLYLDESTLADPTKNVRGGVPLLFPSPGKLENGRWARAGKSGAMKQHGFARDLPWTVAIQSESKLTLTLVSDDATRAVYPWDFHLTLRIVLDDATLRLELHTANTGAEEMPFGFGIHPYFHVTDKAHATISTHATKAYDNVTKQTGPFRGFDLANGETDLHLLDHGSTESTLKRGDEGAVTVRTSPDFGRWVVWTLPGKEFVCLEPWTAPGNALNTGDGLLKLMPGASSDLWIELLAAS
jgi:galactose mutarotase-like enzyme